MIPEHEKKLIFKLKKLQSSDIYRPILNLLKIGKRIKFKKKINSGKIKNVLFTAFNRGFGDVIIYSYSLHSFRKSFPNIKTTILIKPSFIELAKRLNLADTYIDIEEKNEEDFNVILKKTDLIIDLSLEGSDQVRELFKSNKNPFKISFNNSKQAMKADKSYSFKRTQLLSTQYFNLFQNFNIKPFKDAPVVKFNKNEKDKVNTYIKKILKKNTDLLLLAPGSRLSNLGMQRRWPPENYAKLIKLATEKYKLTAVLIGSPQDHPYCESVIKKSKAKALNSAGTFTYIEDAYFISKAKIFISNDSSPVHMAALHGIPSLSFHKNGIDPWHPAQFPNAPKEIMEFDDPKQITPEQAFTAFSRLTEEIGLRKNR